MKFERFLYNCALKGLSVAKYTDVTDLTPHGVKVGEEHCIQLVVEKDNKALSGFDQQFFFGDSEVEVQQKFLDWLDEIVDSDDATYNKVNALNCVIEALRNDSHYRQEVGYE